MSSEKKWPFIQWFVSDWLGDPKVSRCAPETRGILFDWLCNMHALDRSGQITGSREELARLGRCSVVQCEAALLDLKRTNAADVTERNGVVTVLNRRMKREDLLRKSATSRQQRCRGHGTVTPPVTPHNYNQRSEARDQRPESNSEDYSTCTEDGGVGETNAERGTRNAELGKHRTSNIQRSTSNGGNGGGHPASHGFGATGRPCATLINFGDIGRLAGEIMGNEWHWCYDNCRVKITDFTLAGLQTVLRPFVNLATEKQVRRAWCDAVLEAHQACVDFEHRDPVKSAAGLATEKFRERMRTLLSTTDSHE